MLTIQALLAGDKGSRQGRPPFEVVPANDSTAATHVRQRKAEKREPDGWANCVDGALLRRPGGEAIPVQARKAWNLAKKRSGGAVYGQGNDCRASGRGVPGPVLLGGGPNSVMYGTNRDVSSIQSTCSPSLHVPQTAVL
jgi:hypothetical protein